MSRAVFELCAETLDACVAARDGGVDRIELCCRLDVGGLTPNDKLIVAAVDLGLPVHVMLRLRVGNFIYTDAEYDAMLEALNRLRGLGIAGIVAGILTAEGTVDVPRMSRIVERAAPLEVTFHRAFDEAAELDQALEAVIATAARRLLTSGGASDVLQGAARLRELNRQAAGRIIIAAGGGLRLENAAEVARVSGLKNFHGTIRREGSTHAADIRDVIRLLTQG